MLYDKLHRRLPDDSSMKVWCSVDAIKRLIWAERSWCKHLPNWASHPAARRFRTRGACTCQICPLRLGLFRYLFRNEFEAREAMWCDKRHQVAEINVSLIWEFLFMCPNPSQSPPCRPLYSYFLHHNSLGPRIQGDIAMFPVELSR